MYTAAITYSVNAGFVNRQMLFVVVIFPVGLEIAQYLIHNYQSFTDLGAPELENYPIRRQKRRIRLQPHLINKSTNDTL